MVRVVGNGNAVMMGAQARGDTGVASSGLQHEATLKFRREVGRRGVAYGVMVIRVLAAVSRRFLRSLRTGRCGRSA